MLVGWCKIAQEIADHLESLETGAHARTLTLLEKLATVNPIADTFANHGVDTRQRSLASIGLVSAPIYVHQKPIVKVIYYHFLFLPAKIIVSNSVNIQWFNSSCSLPSTYHCAMHNHFINDPLSHARITCISLCVSNINFRLEPSVFYQFFSLDLNLLFI